MPNGKQDWDTRAWLVGILGGVVGGGATAGALYPSFAGRIDAAAHSSGASDAIGGLAALVSLLVLPGLVSGIARRRTFLWGLVPLALFLVAVTTEKTITNGLSSLGNAKDWGMLLLVLGGCLLVSSGPVSLIRYGRVCARRRRDAAIASLVAQREAASIPQEGVWPPPPDYRQ
jgi:hypothetical protein